MMTTKQIQLVDELHAQVRMHVDAVRNLLTIVETDLNDAEAYAEEGKIEPVNGTHFNLAVGALQVRLAQLDGIAEFYRGRMIEL